MRLLGFGVSHHDGSGKSQQHLFDQADRERLNELDAVADQIAQSLAGWQFGAELGGNLVDMSLLSTIGALCLACASEGVGRRVLLDHLLGWAFALTIVSDAGTSFSPDGCPFARRQLLTANTLQCKDATLG